MKQSRFTVLSTAMIATAALGVACSSSDTVSPSMSGAGTMVVRLTDAPFLAARTSAVDSAGADHGLSADSSATGGWKTIASPNVSFNLLSLQDGVSAVIGQTVLPAGTYNGFRFIIDPTRSSVTLKGGQVLSGTSSPGIKFPSANRSGIKVVLAAPLTVVANTTTTLLIDFDVNSSFVMRGNSIDKNGLLFKPVIKATVTNLALTNANVRLVNASDSTLSLLQSAGGVQFATLPSAYVPTAGLTGLRVFNATSGTTALTAGQNLTLAIAPPANGTTALREFLVAGC